MAGAVVAGMLGGVAQAAIPVVSDAALAAAAEACRGIPADRKGARRLLAERGWRRDLIKAGDERLGPGNETEAYGREDVLLLLTAEPNPPGCLILAGVVQSLDSKRVLAIVSSALGRAPALTSEQGADYATLVTRMRGRAPLEGEWGGMWELSGGQEFLVRHLRQANGASVQIIATSSDRQN